MLILKCSRMTSCSFSSPLQSPGAGLVAAVMIAIVPGYISRSVAGSYDNEGEDAHCTFVYCEKSVSYYLIEMHVESLPFDDILS